MNKEQFQRWMAEMDEAQYGRKYGLIEERGEKERKPPVRTIGKSRAVETSDMKLQIEMIPPPLHFMNPRTAMGRKAWDKLRREVYVQYDYRCGICGAEGRLNCHEIWEYDDTNHVQILKGFIALCDWCHHVKHIGYATLLSLDGKLDFGKVIDHFVKVNECTKADFHRAEARAFALDNERSKHQWKSDWGTYNYLMKE